MSSEWQDSNLRPLAPHARMLANCTTPRTFEAAKIKYIFFDLQEIFRQIFFPINATKQTILFTAIYQHGTNTRYTIIPPKARNQLSGLYLFETLHN